MAPWTTCCHGTPEGGSIRQWREAGHSSYQQVVLGAMQEFHSVNIFLHRSSQDVEKRR
jgi:hypothetical protein